MQSDKTICHKINECLSEVQALVNNGSMDVTVMAKYLHEIRLDAQKMENALKRRKKFMATVPGLEEKYQKEKKGAEALPGLNKIATVDKSIQPETKFEFIIKQEGKEIYHVDSHAGVICTVEKIEDMDKDGVILGTTQKMFFGHILSQWYAFDQLSQAMEAKQIQIIAAMHDVIKAGKLSPETRAQIVEAMNR